MKTKLSVGVILLSLVIIFTISCSKKEDILYVGTNAEFQPFEYLEDGKIVGFDIDLITEIAKMIGMKIEVKNLAFDGLIPALQAKKVDIIIAGMTATEDRRQFVNFTEPYYTSKQAIVLPLDNTTITTFDDLVGKKVGVVLGFTGDIAVTDIKEIDVQRYNGSSEAILALKANKIDAVVLDYEPAYNYAIQNSELKMIDTDLAEETYAIALGLDDTELLEKINKALQTIKENGTYDTLHTKYFENKE